MKQWAFTLILLSFFGTLAKFVLPQKEGGSLLQVLRFLLSLSILLTLFSPLVRFREEGFLPEGENAPAWAEKGSIDGQKLVLERFTEQIGKALQTAFPGESFTLSLYTDEAGMPDLITVAGKDKESEQRAADYIRLRYGIKASGKGER